MNHRRSLFSRSVVVRVVGVVAALSSMATVLGCGAKSAGGRPPSNVGSTAAGAVVDPTATLEIMRRVADYELTSFGTTTNNDWVRAVFYTGLMALHRAGGDDRYLAAARGWGLANAWRLGPDQGSAGPAGPGGIAADPRFADNQACVQTYAELYLEDPASRNAATLAPALAAFDQMVAAPRAGRVDWWWCDALFMAPTALVRAAKATGHTAYVDLVDTMFWDTVAFLFDPAQQLFWRDSSYINTATYWSRGNGWVVGGLARVLQELPAGDAHRGDYEDLLRKMAARLRTLQGADGFWRSNLIDPTAFPNPESSGTAFFCYGLAWGINHGVLDRATYLDPVLRAWQGLGSVVSAQGRLGYVQPVGARPGAAAATDTNDYAAGAFLLAGTELLQL